MKKILGLSLIVSLSYCGKSTSFGGSVTAVENKAKAKDSDAGAQVVVQKKEIIENDEPVVAQLIGYPEGTSKVTLLNISVFGKNVFAYKFAVLRENSNCVDGNYEELSPKAIEVSKNLTADISGIQDGKITLCVLGVSPDGRIQEKNVATSVTWQKATSSPIISLAGYPVGRSNILNLDVTVVSPAVTKYKYALVDATTRCDAATYPSSWIDSSVHIKDVIAGVDRELALCAIGQDASGASQTKEQATRYTWIKDTIAPSLSFNNVPTAGSHSAQVNLTPSVNVDLDAVSYRYAAVSGNVCPSSIASYTVKTISSAADKSFSVSYAAASFTEGANVSLCGAAKDQAGNESAVVRVTWIKDTLNPSVFFTGLPSLVSNASILNVTVNGSGVSSYVYDVRPGVDCSNASYGSARSLSAVINDSLTSEGDMRICAKGISASNVQQAVPTLYKWKRDISAPSISFSGVPADNSINRNLNIVVTSSDLDFSAYKYQVLPPGQTACNVNSAAQLIKGESIKTDVSGFADGSIKVCAWGMDSVNNIQSSPITTSWNNRVGCNSSINGNYFKVGDPESQTVWAVANAAFGQCPAGVQRTHTCQAGGNFGPWSGPGAALTNPSTVACVETPNTKPTFPLALGSQSVNEGQAISTVTLSAQDAESAISTYNCTGVTGGSGATCGNLGISLVGNKLNWTPGVGKGNATYVISFNACDTSNVCSDPSNNSKLTVAVNAAPVAIQTYFVFTIGANNNFNLAGYFSDVDGPTPLTYSCVGGCSYLDSSSNQMFRLSSSASSGNYYPQVNVCDGKGACVNTSLSIAINPAPSTGGGGGGSGGGSGGAGCWWCIEPIPTLRVWTVAGSCSVSGWAGLNGSVGCVFNGETITQPCDPGQTGLISAGSGCITASLGDKCYFNNTAAHATGTVLECKLQ